MGVSVDSKHYGFSTGYITFDKLRLEIAGLLGDEWREHYEDMLLAPYDMIWSDYNDKTEEMSEGLSQDDEMVLDFLYASDCEGSLSPEQCRAVMQLMDSKHDVWQADARSWAYLMNDPFTLADFRLMLEDGWNSGYGIEWY